MRAAWKTSCGRDPGAPFLFPATFREVNELLDENVKIYRVWFSQWRLTHILAKITDEVRLWSRHLTNRSSSFEVRR